jgi:hypothetical protein
MAFTIPPLSKKKSTAAVECDKVRVPGDQFIIALLAVNKSLPQNKLRTRLGACGGMGVRNEH